jgi:hypothetical protein
MHNHIRNAGSCVVVSVLTFMAYALSSAPWAHFSSSRNFVLSAAPDFLIPLLGAFVLVLLIKGKGALLWATTLSVPFLMVRRPFIAATDYLVLFFLRFAPLLGALAGGDSGSMGSVKETLAGGA